MVHAARRLRSGERLLDIGCGAGALGLAVADRFGVVYGLDVSSDAVRLAQQVGVHAQVFEAGAAPIPFADGTFDAVTAMSALQYVIELEFLLAECWRVLRPGGQFLASVPNMRAAWRLWTLGVRGDFPRTSVDQPGLDGGAVHYFTTHLISDLLVGAGFEVSSRTGIFCLPRWLEGRLDSGPAGHVKREFCSAEVFVEARKFAGPA